MGGTPSECVAPSSHIRDFCILTQGKIKVFWNITDAEGCGCMDTRLTWPLGAVSQVSGRVLRAGIRSRREDFLETASGLCSTNLCL